MEIGHIYTYEEAQLAAKRVREIRERGEVNKHYSYTNYDELMDLDYTLQEWRMQAYQSGDPRHNDFEEEYDWVRSLTSYFYHKEEAAAGLL